MTSVRRAVTAGAACVAVLAGCTTTSSGEPTSSSTSTRERCAGDDITTAAKDKVTIATYDPVFAPWFVSNEPGNGQGFESALGFHLAKRMGFEPSEVTWVRIPFQQIVQPSSPAKFDFALAEVTITAEREKRVEFSKPYASTRHAVLTKNGSPYAGKRSLNALRSAKLGASMHTTSLSAIRTVIKPTKPATTYPTIHAAATALDQGEVDAVVVDEPTAEYLANSTLHDGHLLGLVPGEAEDIGALMPESSTLHACVNRALDDLRRSGTITSLEQQWLPEPGSTPVLTQESPTAQTSPRSSSRSASPSGKPTEAKGHTAPSPTK